MKSERRGNGRNLATLGGFRPVSLGAERRGESVDLIWPPISRVIKEEAREEGRMGAPLFTRGSATGNNFSD